MLRKVLRYLGLEAPVFVNRVKHHKDNAFMTGDDSGLVLFWDARTGKPTTVINDNADQITAFALDPDGLHCYITANRLY